MDWNDCCKTLDVDPSAPWELIQQAYRDQVKIWHPDRFGHDQRLRDKAQERLKKVNAAYEWLKERKGTRPLGSARSSPNESSRAQTPRDDQPDHTEPSTAPARTEAAAGAGSPVSSAGVQGTPGTLWWLLGAAALGAFIVIASAYGRSSSRRPSRTQPTAVSPPSVQLPEDKPQPRAPSAHTARPSSATGSGRWQHVANGLDGSRFDLDRKTARIGQGWADVWVRQSHPTDTSLNTRSHFVFYCARRQFYDAEGGTFTRQSVPPGSVIEAVHREVCNEPGREGEGSRWQQVANGSDGSRFDLDRETARIGQGSADVWVRQSHPTDPSLNTRFHFVFNCARRQFYDAERGTSTNQGVQPGSVMEAIHREVCRD